MKGSLFMKLLAFAASNSSESINKKLVDYAASLVENADIETLDINDYEMPLYSHDRERDLGIPNEAKAFYAKIGDADALMIAFAEHNGHYTAAYKNLFDWTSRIDMKVYQGKPMIVMATSPGPGGASSVLAAVKSSAPFFGAIIRATVSIPEFFNNFDTKTNTLSNPVLVNKMIKAVDKLRSYAHKKPLP